MSPEEQRIAIAEACGWAHLTQFTNRITNPQGEAIFFNPVDKSKFDFIPNYLNDLNAMHEAEKVLGRDKSLQDYTSELVEAMQRGNRVCEFSTYPSDMIWHATAPQRAEAFLRTLGKWKD